MPAGQSGHLGPFVETNTDRLAGNTAFDRLTRSSSNPTARAHTAATHASQSHTLTPLQTDKHNQPHTPRHQHIQFARCDVWLTQQLSHTHCFVSFLLTSVATAAVAAAAGRQARHHPAHQHMASEEGGQGAVATHQRARETKPPPAKHSTPLAQAATPKTQRWMQVQYYAHGPSCQTHKSGRHRAGLCLVCPSALLVVAAPLSASSNTNSPTDTPQNTLQAASTTYCALHACAHAHTPGHTSQGVALTPPAAAAAATAAAASAAAA